MHQLVVALVHQQIRLADVAIETQQKNDVIAMGLLNLYDLVLWLGHINPIQLPNMHALHATT